MGDHYTFDPLEVPASVARLFPENDRRQEEDGRSVGGADVNVGRIMLPGMEVESIGPDLQQRWHADLAGVSTGHHHRFGGFTTAYLPIGFGARLARGGAGYTRA